VHWPFPAGNGRRRETEQQAMMILRSAPASPFGRKVKIAAALLGVSNAFTVVDADTASETDSIRRENPLGKIPTLILQDGTALYDSRVIVEYLEHVSTTEVRVIPLEAPLRFRSLTLQALADGIMDAALLQVYEGRWRAADRHEGRWVEHQAGKVKRGLAALEAAAPPISPDIGAIALACALGYLDLRFAGAWRDNHPALVAWLDSFAAAVPAYEATKVKPA
jgi:glutathione S-transferase